MLREIPTPILNENSQDIGLNFCMAYFDKEENIYKQICPWVYCRDFLIDVIAAQINKKDIINIFKLNIKYDENLPPPEELYLGVKSLFEKNNAFLRITSPYYLKEIANFFKADVRYNNCGRDIIFIKLSKNLIWNPVIFSLFTFSLKLNSYGYVKSVKTILENMKESKLDLSDVVLARGINFEITERLIKNPDYDYAKYWLFEDKILLHSYAGFFGFYEGIKYSKKRLDFNYSTEPFHLHLEKYLKEIGA